MTRSPVIQRLIALRRAVRARLIACGACLAISSAMGLLLAVVILDFILRLPAIPRAILIISSIAWLAILLRRRIIHPLLSEISLTEIAQHIEQRCAQFQGKLVSSVDFLCNAGTGSQQLMDCVIEEASDRVREARLSNLLTVKPLLRYLALLLATSALVMSLALAFPEHARIGLSRCYNPLGIASWPRRVEIAHSSPTMVCGLGESVSVEMMIVRGDSPNIRAKLHVRSTEGQQSTIIMKATGGGLYRATLDDVRSELTCWFEAGDDDTRDEPVTVTAVSRPEVVAVSATITPPPYMQDEVEFVHEFRNGPAAACEGSVVRVIVEVNKRLPHSDENAQQLLNIDGREPIALKPIENSENLWESTFSATCDTILRFHLEDEHGLRNSNPKPHAVKIKEDAPPSVAITKPESLRILTPDASPALVIEARDDYGISRLALETHRLGDDEPVATPLDIQQPLHPTSVVTNHVLAVASLNVAPGDLVLCRAVAWDNRKLDEKEPQKAVSPSLRVRIVSRAELRSQLREDLYMLRRLIDEARQEQSSVASDTLLASESKRDAQDLSENSPGNTDRQTSPASDELVPAASLRRLAQLQTRIMARMQAVEERSSSIAELVLNNGNREPDIADLMQSVEQTASQLSATSMTSADKSLRRALREPDVNNARQHIIAAHQLQVDASAVLEILLAKLARWSELSAMLDLAREVANGQRILREQTEKFGGQTLGKTTEALTDEERSVLAELHLRQLELHHRVEQLVKTLGLASQELSESDPRNASTLSAAAQKAKRDNIHRTMQEAIDAIEANRLIAGAELQRSLEQTLLQMIKQLVGNNASQASGIQADQLLEELKSMRDAQREIGDGVEQLSSNTSPTISSRQRTRIILGLTRSQREVGDKTTALRDDLEGVAVFEWLLERTASLCDKSIALFEDQQIGTELEQTTKRIERELAELVVAVETAQQLTIEHARRETSKQGDKAGHTHNSQATPSLAELLIIKGTQDQINHDTINLNNSADASKLAAAYIKEAESLGAEQKELHTLTCRVVQDATAEVPTLMKRSANLLSESHDSGKETQQVQSLTASLLDQVIQQALANSNKQPAANQRSAQSAASGPNGRTAKSDPLAGSRPNQSRGAPIEAVIGIAPIGRSGAWGMLPEQDREEILQGSEESFLLRYEKLIAQYYRALQEGED